MRSFIVAAVLFSLCRLAGPPGASAQDQTRPAVDQRPEATTDKAESQLAAGRVDEAINTLNAIRRTSSNEPLINHLLGLAYYQKSDYPRAIELLKVSAAAAPKGSKQRRQALRLLGMSHYLIGHLSEAVPYLEQVRAGDPGDVEIAFMLGNAYIQARNLDKARASFAVMFSVAPDSGAAYLINAQMMIRQQFEELAEVELRKALELDPKLPEANFLLAEMAIYHANVDAGIALLEKEIAINPAFAMAYYMLGEALTRQLKWPQAIAPLQKSIWLNPFFSGPYIVLGKVYLKTGDLANAESMLRRALKMDPNNFSGHHLLAQVLQQDGNLDDAKKEFELADRLRTSSER
jgi:tetratricopeptide (TPR) repeat protein